jgi:hypothetical protein
MLAELVQHVIVVRRRRAEPEQRHQPHGPAGGVEPATWLVCAGSEPDGFWHTGGLHGDDTTEHPDLVGR